MRFRTPTVVHPVAIIALSVISFYVLDTGLFRSGLYTRLLSPATTAGKLVSVLDYERARPANPKTDVLLLGNSKMEWGFSVKQFEHDFPQSHLRIIMGAASGSTEEWWYYMLRNVDPKRDRYAAVVVPVAGYEIDAHALDYQNRFDNAQTLAPILTTADWFDLLRAYSNPELQKRAALLAAFSSHAYSLDLQDLILHPEQRQILMAWRKAIGERWMYNEAGLAGSLETLTRDPQTGGVTHYPSYFTEFKKRETDDRLIPAPMADVASATKRNAAFETEWVQRIADYYAGTATQVLFIAMPRWPFPLPSMPVSADAPDIRNLVHLAGNESFLAANKTQSLENPQYFYDAEHMNTVGRGIFTDTIGQAIETRLIPD